MKRIITLTILTTFIGSSCNENLNQEKLFYTEFYSAVNYHIQSKFDDTSSIFYTTIPACKAYLYNLSHSADTIPPPPPYPGAMCIYSSNLDQLVSDKILDSLEAKYMYASIDSSFIFFLDTNQMSLPIISKPEFNQLFNSDKNGGYQKLKEKYGSSCFLKVTTPIFNADFTKMIISVSDLCGPKWGGGFVFVLQKKNGKWNLIYEEARWIS